MSFPTIPKRLERATLNSFKLHTIGTSSQQPAYHGSKDYDWGQSGSEFDIVRVFVTLRMFLPATVSAPPGSRLRPSDRLLSQLGIPPCPSRTRFRLRNLFGCVPGIQKLRVKGHPYATQMACCVAHQPSISDLDNFFIRHKTSS